MLKTSHFSRHNYFEMFMPFMIGGRPKYPNFDKIAEELIDELENYVTE